MTPELTVDDALIMANECPLIRAAYASDDPAVIARTEAYHPASKCHYVKERMITEELRQWAQTQKEMARK